MKTRVERVYQHSAEKHHSEELLFDQHSTILHKASVPDFRQLVSLSAELHYAQRHILRLADEHCNALDMLRETNRTLIRGPAASYLLSHVVGASQNQRDVLVLDITNQTLRAPWRLWHEKYSQSKNQGID